jgi:DUF1680 family protein
MLRLDPNRKYADVLEQAIYNGTLSGMDLDGKRFFYVNPLEVNPFQKNRKDQEHVKTERQKWFFCACCPPNLARMIASVEDNAYTQTEDTLYTHLYIAGKVQTVLSGRKVELTQSHNYPWEGDISVTMNVEDPVKFKLALRIPGWCKTVSAKVNGNTVSVDELDKGYLIVDRIWQTGDTVTLDLDMEILRMHSNPLVSMNQCQTALQRGPIVYCIEEVDNGPNLAAIRLPNQCEIISEYEPDLLNGVVTLRAEGYRIESTSELYSAEPIKLIPQKITAIPYYAWCNRAKGEMRVWIYEL